jgi:hypothetical protein
MAAIALAALASGFLTGAAKRVTREREESEELIQNRLKMAVLNKKASDEKRAARRDELQQRLEMVSPFFQSTGDPEMDEKLKLGLISSSLIAKQFAEQAQNEVVDPQKFLRLQADKIPKNFTSVKDFVASAGEAPEPVAPDQMQGMLSRTGFLGADVGVSPERADRLARSLGAGSAAELLSYESREPVDTTSLMELATINVDLYPAQAKTPEQQLNHLQGRVVQFSRIYGEYDDRTKEARAALSTTEAAIKTLSKPQQEWGKRRPVLVATIANDTSSAEEKQKAREELERGDAADKNMLSPGDLFKFAQAAGTAALNSLGSKVKDNIAFVPSADGIALPRYIGDPDSDIAKQVKERYENAVKAVLNRYRSPDTGRLINDAYQSVYDSLLPSVKPLEPVTPVTEPPPARQSTTTNGLGARSQPAPAAAAAQPAQPARVSVDVNNERREALKAIQDGRDERLVRERFKQRTGEDL